MKDDCSLIAWIHRIIDEYKKNHLPDTEMSDDSENPVQNKVIKKYVDEKEITISKEKANAILKYGDGLYVQDKAEQLSNMQSVFENTVASMFSEEKEYHVGEYVVHENQLYRFTGEKSVGPWDSGKATEGSIMSELNAIRDKTDLLQGDQGDYSIQITKELQQLHQVDAENQYLHDHVEFNDYAGVDSAPDPGDTIEQMTSGKSIKMLHQLTKLALKGLLELAKRALAVAMGKNQAKVFDTVADLDAWLTVPANLNTLSVGDHFYIKEVDVPDYWWDGVQKQKLETQKVDLAPYDQKITELKNKDAELGTKIDTHLHDDRYYSETEIDGKMDTKSDVGHDHTWGEITGKPTSFTPSTHNHDDRYFTETEITDKLDTKSDIGHGHVWSEVSEKPTEFPAEAHNHDDLYYTEHEVDIKLDGKSDADHNHDETYYLKSDIDEFLREKSDVDHDHNWENILGKPESFPVSSHDHDDVYYTKTELDGTLSGMATLTHDHDDRYYTVSEIISLLSDKSDVTHTHNYASSTHVHDDRYYTKSYISNVLSSFADASHEHAWGDITDKPTEFNPSSHTHNYAGSTTAGGSATSAGKLDSNAGSTTQPVYFKDGKPTACTYTLGKSVPVDAVFTDTNTVPEYKRISCTRNPTNTTDGWIVAHQYGRIVYVKAWISIAATVTGIYQKIVIGSGLPKAIEDEDFFGICEAGVENSNPIIGVRSNGELYLDVRDESLAGHDMFVAGTYISGVDSLKTV